MESGAICDGQITASSQHGAFLAAVKGRLIHFRKTCSFNGAWSAATNDPNQWLQVYLGNEAIVITRLATQGRNDASQWVTKYNLQYSDDKVNFRYYRETGNTLKKVKYN